jgi:hypothetical protein
MELRLEGVSKKYPNGVQALSEVKFTVKSKLARVGIDPMNELVDKTPDDNLATPESVQ